MKNPIKLWTLILLFGTLVQILGISLFSSTSTTGWSRIGQPTALGVTLLGIIALLWFAFTNRNRPGTIILAGVALGAAYMLAFHLVGIVSFPGLLRDADAQGYWISILRVFAAAVVIHTGLAAVVFCLMRMRWLRTSRIV